MNLETTPDQLRPFVIESIRRARRPSEQQHQTLYGVFHDVADKAKHLGLKHGTAPNLVDGWVEHTRGVPDLRDIWKGWAISIVWDLIHEGVLCPGTADGEKHDMPYFFVTEYGRIALREPLNPHDQEGYLVRLRAEVPAIDSVIVTYIHESVVTLRRNCLLSSTITMGCASEKAFLLLTETFADALNPTDQATFRKAMERARSIKPQYEVFKEWYEKKLQPQLKTDLGTDWLSQMDSAFYLLLSYFRVIRNEAGHPHGSNFTRDVVHGHLVLFPHYLRHIYELMEWIKSRKPL